MGANDLDYLMKVRDERDDLIKENKILLKLLWLNHGHRQSQLYGDDGEMQCRECLREYGFYDWKRTPVKTIQELIEKANLREIAKGDV